MNMLVTSEAYNWLRANGFDDFIYEDDLTYVDAYDLESWLEDMGYSYSGSLLDGFVVNVNASESYSFYPNN